MGLANGEEFGPYKIVGPLGRGGMAPVYKAYEPKLDRHIALKVLPQEFLHDPTFAKRFLREAKAVGSLEHPNIVPIYAFDIENGVPWMALRLVPGGALSGIVKRGRLDPARAVRILKGTAEALTYAHSKGFVHCDVKPQNILLDENERVYLADFGITKMLEGANKLTQTGMISGTPQYMAPEQATATKVDGRADTYALGIVAYELLTGHVPFSADTPVAVLVKHMQEPIPLPPPTEVSEPVVRVLVKALAKKPEDRWPSAVAFVAALESALGDAPTATVLPTLELTSNLDELSLAEPTLAARAPPRPATRPTVPAPTRPPRMAGPSTVATAPSVARSTTPLLAGAIASGGALALVLAAVVWFWMSKGSSSDADRAVPSPAVDGATVASKSSPPSTAAAAASPPPTVQAAPPPEPEPTLPAPVTVPAATVPAARPTAAPPSTTLIARKPESVAAPAATPPPPVATLAPAGPSPEVQALLGGLTDRSPDVRWKAAESLGSLGEEAASAVPHLVEGLADRSDVVRWRSAEALGKIGSTKAVGPLAASLKDRDPLVRTESARALTRIGPRAKEATAALAANLSDTDVYSRRQAAKALVAIGKDSGAALPALVEALKDKDKFVRLESARALGLIGPEARTAVPALTLASKDGEPLVARAAAEAVRRITGEGSPVS
jgi:serine/threonine-protein kinase